MARLVGEEDLLARPRLLYREQAEVTTLRGTWLGVVVSPGVITRGPFLMRMVFDGERGTAQDEYGASVLEVLSTAPVRFRKQYKKSSLKDWLIYEGRIEHGTLYGIFRSEKIKGFCGVFAFLHESSLTPDVRARIEAQIRHWSLRTVLFYSALLLAAIVPASVALFYAAQVGHLVLFLMSVGPIAMFHLARHRSTMKMRKRVERMEATLAASSHDEA